MDKKKMKFSDIGKIAILLVVSAALITGCAASKGAKQESMTEAAAEAPAVTLITGISASEDSDSVDIRVTGNQLLTYTSVKQPSPAGVILYFPETSFNPENVQTGMVADSDVIETVNIEELTEKGKTTRLEILLKMEAAYEVNRDGSDLVISFGKTPVAETPADAAPEAASAEKPADTPLATRFLSVTAEPSENEVAFSVTADGTIRDYQSFTIKNPARIVFDLFNISSDSEKEQVVQVNTPWVKQVRHYGYPDRVRIVLDTEDRYLSAFKADPAADGLTIRVGSGSSGETGAAKTEAGSAPMPAATSDKPAWVNRNRFFQRRSRQIDSYHRYHRSGHLRGE